MVLAGGLHVILSRLALDAVAWLGLAYAVWTPPRLRSALVLAVAVGLTFGTAGLTTRWPLTFPMVPLVFLQGIRQLLARNNHPKSDPARLTRWLQWIVGGLSTLLVISSLCLAILFPPLQLPKVQAGGPFAVGSVHFFVPVTNSSSPHSCNTNHSHVQARLLYPTTIHNDATAAKKMPYLPPSLAHEFTKASMQIGGPDGLKAYDWLMHHWLLAELPLHPNAPLYNNNTDNKQQLPLVVFSHGLVGSADLYSYQAMSLASQGFLVVMVNHLDGSAPVAARADGSLHHYDHGIVELWKQGEKEAYVRERRLRTDWRVCEMIGAAEAMLNLHQHGRLPADGNATASNEDLSGFFSSLQGRVDTEKVFVMGHSFGGATALTAANRRPDLVRGGVIAHEPAVDWMPDDARRALFALEKLQGLESSQNFTGGTGGLDYDVDDTQCSAAMEEEETDPTQCSASVHDLNMLFLYSDEWRKLNWGESHVLEEMHQNGRLGTPHSIAHYAVIPESTHSVFSDMCLLTPLWLARAVGFTGARNPVETVRDIEEQTWSFVSSVLSKATANS